MSARRKVVESADHANAPALSRQPGADIQEVNPGCSETLTTLTLADAARLVRDAMRDNTYRGTPLGEHVGAFMRYTLNQDWEQRSRAEYESTLYRFVLYFADLDLPDFHPTRGHRASGGLHRVHLGDGCQRDTGQEHLHPQELLPLGV